MAQAQAPPHSASISSMSPWTAASIKVRPPNAVIVRSGLVSDLNVILKKPLQHLRVVLQFSEKRLLFTGRKPVGGGKQNYAGSDGETSKFV